MNPILNAVAFFQNFCPVNVAVTLTITASDGPWSGEYGIENVASGGGFSNVLVLHPGQTITAVFDVSSGGGFLQGVGPNVIDPLPATWQLVSIV
jgi:hypothetical protein